MATPSPKRVRMEKLDRLSYLPPEVIDEFLKRLPLRDAVRTSVLSKTWRFKWMFISEMMFDARSIPPLASTKQRHVQLVNIVNHVLFLHNGTISKFVVCEYLESDCNDVDRWILILARKSVQELMLMFRSGTTPYKVPSSLYNCQNLRKLKLAHCELKLLSGPIGFNNLNYLDLLQVSLTNETIAIILMNNPLTRLRLMHCYGFTHLNISAPNLESLVIDECCEDIKFDYTPKLRRASIRLLGHSAQNLLPRNHKTCNLEDALASLINIQRLDLYKNFMEMLAVCVIPEKLSISYDLLEFLKLDLNFKDPRHILTALCLFRSSPSLQEISIKSYSSTELLVLDEEFWEARQPQHEKEIIFPKLRIVRLTQFNGIQCELGFIEFLLMKAMVLETLHIKWNSSVHKTQVLEDILQFPRASPRAKVISTGGKI